MFTAFGHVGLPKLFSFVSCQNNSRENFLKTILIFSWELEVCIHCVNYAFKQFGQDQVTCHHLEVFLEVSESITDIIYEPDQTIIHQYKHHENVQPSLLLIKETRWTCFVTKCADQPKDKSKTPWERLADAGESVSLSSLNRVLYRHERPLYWLKDHFPGKTIHKKARLEFADAHRDKETCSVVWRN